MTINTTIIIFLFIVLFFILIYPYLCFIPVEISVSYTKDKEYSITKLHFRKEKVNIPKKEPQVYYVPYVGNSVFYGRTIFKKESLSISEYGDIIYGHDGYKKIKEKDIKDIFREILD